MQATNIQIIEILLIPLFLILSGFVGCFIFLWKSPDQNNVPIVVNNANSISLKSIKSLFFIEYIANSKPGTTSPYFPAISASCNETPNAWVQIASIDGQKSVDGQDSVFYTFEPTFTCSPHHSYTLLSKPVQWIAHTYAVKFVDDDIKLSTKKIQIIGGFAWGWELTGFNLWPKMIEPTPLNIHSWVHDFELLKTTIQSKTKAVHAQITALQNSVKIMDCIATL